MTGVIAVAGRCANTPGRGRTRGRGSTMAMVVVCEACGGSVSMPPSRAVDRGRLRRWCSAACQFSYVRPCLACGSEMLGAIDRKFCDYRCSNHYRSQQREGQRLGRICRGCGVAIPPTLKAGTVYCTSACKDASRKADLKVARRAVVKPCVDCGADAEFRRSRCEDCRSARKQEVARVAARRTYQKHREKRVEESRLYRESNRQYFKDWYQQRRSDPAWLSREQARVQVTNRRRRALMASLPSEPYTTAEIAERDGWRCQLCGMKVPAAKRHPDPKSASIDHIIPISRGGGDVKANVQLTHFSCNIAKNNRALPQGEQLRLIG